MMRLYTTIILIEYSLSCIVLFITYSQVQLLEHLLNRVCLYLYLLLFLLEWLDVLSSLFPSRVPLGSRSLIVLSLYSVYVSYVSYAKPNHSLFLSCLLLLLQHCMLTFLRRRKKANKEKRRKKNGTIKNVHQKKRSGENSLV